MTRVMKKFTTCLSWKPKPNRKPRFFLKNLPKPTDRKHFEIVTTLFGCTWIHTQPSASKHWRVQWNTKHWPWPTVWPHPLFIHHQTHHTTTTTVTALFRDHPGEPVPEENFWTLWCKGRLTEADTPTIRLGATPSGLTSANLRLPPYFFTGRMPFLPPNQQCQSTEGN